VVDVVLAGVNCEPIFDSFKLVGTTGQVPWVGVDWHSVVCVERANNSSLVLVALHLNLSNSKQI
jgi:hypothetical protein